MRGDCIKLIGEEIRRTEEEQQRKKWRFERYGELMEALGLYGADSVGAFLVQCQKCAVMLEEETEAATPFVRCSTEIIASFLPVKAFRSSAPGCSALLPPGWYMT